MSHRLPAVVAALLQRDLDAFIREVEAYPDDALPWAEVPGLPNTTGTLALHVAGNLRHFVGHVLGGRPYIRDRKREFAARGLTRRELVEELRAAREEVAGVLVRLPDEALAAGREVTAGDWQVPAPVMLAHLATHLAYHLGQADSHRRIATGNPAGVGAVGLAEVGTGAA